MTTTKELGSPLRGVLEDGIYEMLDTQLTDRLNKRFTDRLYWKFYGRSYVRHTEMLMGRLMMRLREGVVDDYSSR